jgi:hypothetical protein
LIRLNLSRLVFVLLSLTASGTCQSIKAWWIVAAPSFGQDSCQPMANPEQLQTALAKAGWTKGGNLPGVDWNQSIVLLTSADQVSKPWAGAPSQDGSKFLIEFKPADQRNSGVFLLEIQGHLGSSNACSVYSMRNIKKTLAHNQTSTSTTITAVQTTTKSSAKSSK